MQGLKAYIEDMWNIVEFATTSLYITAFTLKFVSYFLVCLYNIIDKHSTILSIAV